MNQDIYRYSALALRDWGESDGDGFIAGTEEYLECYDDDLDHVIKTAESWSLTGEAYRVEKEWYNPKTQQFESVERINPY